MVHLGVQGFSKPITSTCFLDGSFLIKMRWSLRVSLICISLMARDFEGFHVFTGPLHFFFEELSLQFIRLFCGIFVVFNILYIF